MVAGTVTYDGLSLGLVALRLPWKDVRIIKSFNKSPYGSSFVPHFIPMFELIKPTHELMNALGIAK